MKRGSSFLPSPYPPASPPFLLSHSSSLHLLRASTWNMAGRKESTIGVLSSDRCPCCAFSTQCEQALGWQPHKTWKNLTCVQNSSSRRRSLKQTRTHASTTSCRHTTHVHKQAFPSGYKAHIWRKWAPRVHIRKLTYWTYWLGFCYAALCEDKKPRQLFLCSFSAGKENRWAAIDLTAWQTALFLLSATVRYVSGNQFCHNSAIKWRLCLSDNCLTAQCQAGSIISFTAIDVALAFVIMAC